MIDDRRTVTNALLAQTNSEQGDWTSARALRLVTVGHGPVTPTGFETAVGLLVEEGLVKQRCDELRPTDDLDRVRHPGET